MFGDSLEVMVQLISGNKDHRKSGSCSLCKCQTVMSLHDFMSFPATNVPVHDASWSIQHGHES